MCSLKLRRSSRRLVQPPPYVPQGRLHGPLSSSHATAAAAAASLGGLPTRLRHTGGGRSGGREAENGGGTERRTEGERRVEDFRTVCVRACACAYVRACACVHARVPVLCSARMHLHVSMMYVCVFPPSLPPSLSSFPPLAPSIQSPTPPCKLELSPPWWAARRRPCSHSSSNSCLTMVLTSPHARTPTHPHPPLLPPLSPSRRPLSWTPGPTCTRMPSSWR